MIMVEKSPIPSARTRWKLSIGLAVLGVVFFLFERTLALVLLFVGIASILYNWYCIKKSLDT